ncbi:PepSY domain-containing protein [Kordiimonas marina]|uniref:PepSY domain-containing protein n=1 Tax=Kordiimonas marina TaxID=2872312 RepID=UPI001FF5EBE9|nr:hypothetical protein [Kordiimonas marina]MCJ9429512.1 hypothetical protein [Kordiimonas marina]
MKRIIWILLFCFAISILEAGGTAAFAFAPPKKYHGQEDEHDEALDATRHGDILPYWRIRRMVEDRLDGKIVGQKLRRTNQGWQYDLRVRRKDGKVLVAIVNAATGAIISVR